MNIPRALRYVYLETLIFSNTTVTLVNSGMNGFAETLLFLCIVHTHRNVSFPIDTDPKLPVLFENVTLTSAISFFSNFLH